MGNQTVVYKQEENKKGVEKQQEIVVNNEDSKIQQSTKVDLNLYSQQLQQQINNPQKRFVGRVTNQDLIACFNSSCIDNLYLNKERFNLSIKKLLYNMNLPTIANTYLADRLYDLVDNSGDGRISIDEYIEGMSKVLSDGEFCRRISFGCIMKSKENRNYIKFSELLYFFYSGWISGYTLLGSNLQKEKDELLKQSIEIPSINQLVTWAKNYQDNIKIYLQSSLRESGIDSNSDISYDQYKYWIQRNPQNIQLVYANKFLTIATNLTSLDDVEYIEIK